MNKYQRIPELILDLHGFTVSQARKKLEEIVDDGQLRHVRIITGKATFRENGPVLRQFVEQYLKERDIKYDYAKLANGGQGALEVFLE